MSRSLQDIIDLYKETFYTEDDASIALIAAILIGSHLDVPPVWLYLIGPSSGGKSALIECFNKLPFCTQVSDLTPNTFLSGMSSGTRETSLLNKLGVKFTILMKDFTTILSKSEETQQAIISQMREIYDGHITKETGTGITLEWGGKEKDKKGHATFIMASTEAIYSVQDKFADMGTRAINYVLKPQDRKITTKMSLRRNSGLSQKVDELQDAFLEFVMDKMRNIPKELPYVSEELENDIVELGDFSTLCRSVVKRDYKGAKNLALSAEMPMRMSKQLLTSTQIFIYMSNGVLPDYLRETIYKISFDSIPKQRLLVLDVLAKYNRVSKTGISDLVNYPPERCTEWMEDLHMFRIIDRIKVGGRQFWKMKQEYKDIMHKYRGTVCTDEDLDSEDEGGGFSSAGNYEDVSYETIEQLKSIEESAQKSFDSI